MIRLAWRNLWRNRRRSLITLVSIGAGLAAILFGQSMVKSIQGQLVEKATGILIGHLQVEGAGVEDPKMPDKPFAQGGAIEEALAGDPRIEAFERRILFTGLVSSPASSKGVLICAVEPGKDRGLFSLPRYMVQGSYLPSEERVMALGDKLARELDLRMGEKAVVMAQSSDGSLGAEAFRVAGIYHTGSQAFDAQIVYVPLSQAQPMLGLAGKVTDYVARVRSLDELDAVRAALASRLWDRRELAVMSWKEVDRELVGIQSYQNGLMAVVLAIIFAIVALGILNTLLMSIYERVREFGVLKAIGAKPRTLLQLVLLESLMLGALGTLLGLALGSALIAYFGRTGLPLPIGEAIQYFMPFDTTIYLKFAWERHWYAVVTVFATCVGAALPPALRAARLNAAEAVRHV